MKATLSFNTKEYQEYSAVIRVLDDIQADLVSVTRKITDTGIEMHFVVEITITSTEAAAYNLFKAEYMKVAQMYMQEFDGLNLSNTWNTMQYSRPNTD